MLETVHETAVPEMVIYGGTMIWIKDVDCKMFIVVKDSV